LPTAALEILV